MDVANNDHQKPEYMREKQRAQQELQKLADTSPSGNDVKQTRDDFDALSIPTFTR